MNLLSQTRISPRVTASTLLVLLLVATNLFAADTEIPDDPEQLRKIIEAQQAQLEAQEKTLQELLQRVEALTSDETAPAAAPETPAAEPDWPGSFSLLGSKTRLAVGGYVQLDVIHDTDAIGSPCQFITATIPTDGGTTVNGADGRTSFCVNTSRLTFESRTPTKLGRLKTFISLDLFGDALSTSPEPRMRQAYGEIEGALWGGDLLFGQAWGTYVDLEAWPDILDFEGPGSAIALRHPMVRWSKMVAESIRVQVALEEPGAGAILGADTLTRWPDLVGNVKWAHGAGHLRGAGIVRDIRASADDGPAVSDTGWGIAGSGKLVLAARNNLVFEASYGQGVGGYHGDGPLNGFYDPDTSRLELLPLFAYYVGYEHSWNSTLSSAVLYSSIEVEHRDSLPDSVGQKSAYFSLNLIWRPDSPLMFGAEFLSGGRRDMSGAEGNNNRIQVTSRFTF